MSAIDWQKLKQDATETIQGINTDKLTKDAYILLGASLAILTHEEPSNTIAPMAYETPVQMQSYAPVTHNGNISLMELVEDELSDSEKYYAMGEHDISRDELRHADRFLSILRAQSNKQDIQDLIARRDMIASKIQ